MAKLLQPGDPAPDFDASDQHDRKVRLSEQRGRWVVLYFYPKDQTTNCTIEACGFRDAHDQVQAEHAVVFGVSHDTVASHKRFSERRHLPFSLLADPERRIIHAYGVQRWHGWARRVTYIIDPQGRVARVYPRVRARHHTEHVLSDLHALRAAADRKVP